MYIKAMDKKVWVSISCAALAFALAVPVAFGQSKQRRPTHPRANTHRQRSSRGYANKALARLLNDLRAKGLWKGYPPVHFMYIKAMDKKVWVSISCAAIHI